MNKYLWFGVVFISFVVACFCIQGIIYSDNVMFLIAYPFVIGIMMYSITVGIIGNMKRVRE